jgi:acetoacetate decarboxylase
MKSVNGEAGPVFVGDADLELFASPTEEFDRLEVRELIGATYRQVGATFVGGETLQTYHDRG